MDPLGTLEKVVGYVKTAVDLYNQIKDKQEQVQKIGKRITRLLPVLENLEDHLRSKSKYALAKLRQKQTQDLLEIINDTKDHCKAAEKLMYNFHHKIGPKGIKFRENVFAQFVADGVFTFLGPAKELDALADSIDADRTDLVTYMSMMGMNADQANYSGIQNIQREVQALGALLQAGSLSPTPSQPALRPNYPPPSPTPPRRDYKIIIVDPYNTGRSIVCESLLKIYQGWSTKAGKDWRIEWIHSAGFFVKSRSDCTDVIDKMDFKYESHKLNLATGNQRPMSTALDALFDNSNYDFLPFKKELKDTMAKRTSRGLRRNIFQTYDFIIVFTGREHENMIRLREALGESRKSAAGKGRLVLLGQYSGSRELQEIVNPAKNKDGSESRENWNKKVAQMKIATKGFLRQEMEWEQPKAKHDAK